MVAKYKEQSDRPRSQCYEVISSSCQIQRDQTAADKRATNDQRQILFSEISLQLFKQNRVKSQLGKLHQTKINVQMGPIVFSTPQRYLGDLIMKIRVIIDQKSFTFVALHPQNVVSSRRPEKSNCNTLTTLPKAVTLVED